MSLKKEEKPKQEKKGESSISKFLRGRKGGAGQAKDKAGPKAEAAGKEQAINKTGQKAEAAGKEQAINKTGPKAEAGRNEQARPKLEHEVKVSILSKFFGRGKGGIGPKIEEAKAGQAAKTEPKTAPHERQEQVIYTAIDQIIEIVDSRGELPLQEVSTILNIPPERMEELAKILDEHGILQLHYPSNPLAKPVLRSLTKHDFKRLGRHSE